mgnify:CR=1 FL=1
MQDNTTSASESRITGTRVVQLGIVAVVAILAVPAIAFAFYGSIGAPRLPDQPLALREQPQPGRDDFDLATLVDKAEARLRTNPEDGSGWEVLAPIYLRMNRPQDAAEPMSPATAHSGAGRSSVRDQINKRLAGWAVGRCQERNGSGA